MLNPIKTKTKKIISKENKNAKKVISVKRKLGQLKVVKSNLGCKASNTEIKNRVFKIRKNSMKKILSKSAEECSVSKKLRNHVFKKSQLTSSIKNTMTKKNKSRNVLNSGRSKAQSKILEKKSLKNTLIKDSKNLIKSNSTPIFVSLSYVDEGKKYKNKFRKPANGKKLKSLLEKLWKKSSYHKRFLEKSNSLKLQKTEKSKNKVLKSKRQCLPPKEEYSGLQKSESKMLKSRFVVVEKKASQQNLTCDKPSNPDEIIIKKEIKTNADVRELECDKLSKDDVSKVDESYIKSLLSVAKRSIESENSELRHQSKSFCRDGTENDSRTKITGKEYSLSTIKNKKTVYEFNLKNVGNKTGLSSSPESEKIKNQQYSKGKDDGASVLRDVTKSETQVKLWKKKTADVTSKEVKNKQKKSYSKHEISCHQQKKKNRNIVKSKKNDNIEMPFPCELLKTEEIQELWKRENFEKHRNSLSSISLSTVSENGNNHNVKGLGMESYQMLKRFVEDEVGRISRKYNKNEADENGMDNDKGNRKKENNNEQNASTKEKQLSGLIRKKLAVKSRERFLQEEKPDDVKAKLKMSEKEKIPDEIIKNWSIVNRLEQAFLVLGAPNFRKMNNKEPAPTNVKRGRTMERNTTAVKKEEKIIKVGEKKEKNQATHVADNKQKTAEANKSSVKEKQVNVLHKKELTPSSRKPETPASMLGPKYSKVERSGMPKEKKTQSQAGNATRVCKPLIRPTTQLTSKSGIKPPSIVTNVKNKGVTPQPTGKLGKENSSRNHLCEPSNQSNNDDNNLERKKTFHIISLKNYVIMQPHRSKSCNKIEGNSEVERKNSFLSTGSQENKSMSQQNQEFWDFFYKTEKMKAERKSESNGKGPAEQMGKPVPLKSPRSEADVGKSETLKESFEDKKSVESFVKQEQEQECDKIVSLEFLEKAQAIKDLHQDTKARNIKERSVLSIRTSHKENQTSATFLFHMKKESVSKLFTETLNPPVCYNDQEDVKNVTVYLPPTKSSYSDTSCVSVSKSSNDVIQSVSESSVKERVEMTIDNESDLMKAASSKNIEITSSQTSTTNKEKPKVIKIAPWEEDINYYRALVREILSQYKRLDGFLMQSENVKILPEDSEELKTSVAEEQVGDLKEKLNIEDYRKKIIMEYQKLPIFEYKSKMQKTQEKPEGRSKRRNLLVVQPANVKIDLDVKDYEPRMKTVLGSLLYFDKDNIRQRREMGINPNEKKISLQEVILFKHGKPKNCSKAISTPKSCLFYSKSREQNSLDENKSKEKCRDFEFCYLVSTKTFSKL